ncbi:MAG: DNA-directed RNA polymerase subunit omega [Oscillospiraceae bacterium]|jgi:DNA-directed RNA polymerase subunit omega|nr:DNA-directed RNA polymerase subunit omega [Oscillospiraceae bacterium]
MMLYPSLSQLLEKVNSRYLLVNVIAKRARELSNASERRGESLQKKAVSCAIDEIARGDIRAETETRHGE